MNDRTWCFWEKEAGFFESIVYKHWEKIWFHGKGSSRLLELTPYHYKLVRGIDFYDYCLDLISKHPSFNIRYGSISGFGDDKGIPTIRIDNETISAKYIFNSILFTKPALKKNEYYLLQHFRGWLIETEKAVFDPSIATLMDFRVDQRQGTTFVYVMPFSSTKALVEYTLFSESLLESNLYDEGLKHYISEILHIGSYTIKEVESGVIPMTNHQFPTRDGNIINIGTAGGQTKGSSGYTFRFIQKHSEAIVKRLIAGSDPVPATARKKFNFYDSVLLNILYNRKVPGEKIFADLFQKNKPQRLLRFLDNESSLRDDLKIISSLPTGPFLRAGIREL